MPEETVVPFQDGDTFEYAIVDSGRSFDAEGLFLAPGEIYTVGEDTRAEFADRLLETGLIRRAAVAIEEAEPAADVPAPPVSAPAVVTPPVAQGGPIFTSSVVPALPPVVSVPVQTPANKPTPVEVLATPDPVKQDSQ